LLSVGVPAVAACLGVFDLNYAWFALFGIGAVQLSIFDSFANDERKTEESEEQAESALKEGTLPPFGMDFHIKMFMINTVVMQILMFLCLRSFSVESFWAFFLCAVALQILEAFTLIFIFAIYLLSCLVGGLFCYDEFIQLIFFVSAICLFAFLVRLSSDAVKAYKKDWISSPLFKVVKDNKNIVYNVSLWMCFSPFPLMCIVYLFYQSWGPGPDEFFKSHFGSVLYFNAITITLFFGGCILAGYVFSWLRHYVRVSFFIGVSLFLFIPFLFFLYNLYKEELLGEFSSHWNIFYMALFPVSYFVVMSVVFIQDEKDAKVRFKDRILSVAGMAAVMMRYNGGYTDGARQLFRNFLAERYSGARFYEERLAEDAEKRLELLIGKRKLSFKKFCLEVNLNLSYEEKVNVMRLLFDIAILDGSIYPEERNILSNIMVHIRISEEQVQTYDSMYSRYYYDSRTSRESAKGAYTSSGTYMPSRVVEAYAQLGLKVGTAFDEVKRVYRRLVFENHPDRLAHADEASRAAANTRIRELNSAMRVIEDFAAKG
jgi:DnaJ like chaperone protein